MALPTLETPTYELTLPSADLKVKFRPFLVKEEKILLQAIESNENNQITQALKDIVNACTFGQLNGENMPTFDLEYVFLQIRAKSVGEVAKLKMLCPDDKKTYGEVEIDLTKVNVQVDDDHTNNIVIDEEKNIGIIMKYPTIDSVDTSKTLKGMRTEQLFDMIATCMHEIYEGDKVHNVKDYSKEELHKFLESVDGKTFEKINKFFESMPQLKHEFEIENPKTKVKSKIVLKGSTGFFRIALSHDSLENHYQTNFALVQHHKYSLTELENMLPWEREIYIQQLLSFLKEERERAKERAMKK
tara:strand:- start:76 stop:978 length:903 start_codon:yes stop_codon:yes gene_type:complete